MSGTAIARRWIEWLRETRWVDVLLVLASLAGLADLALRRQAATGGEWESAGALAILASLVLALWRGAHLGASAGAGLCLLTGSVAWTALRAAPGPLAAGPLGLEVHRALGPLALLHLVLLAVCARGPLARLVTRGSRWVIAPLAGLAVVVVVGVVAPLALPLEPDAVLCCWARWPLLCQPAGLALFVALPALVACVLVLDLRAALRARCARGLLRHAGLLGSGLVLIACALLVAVLRGRLDLSPFPTLDRLTWRAIERCGPTPWWGEGRVQVLDRPRAAGPGRQIELVFDVSRSMGDPLTRTGPGRGLPKIDAARDAVERLTAALPDDVQLALRVYGYSCDRTDLVLPLGILERARLVALVRGLSPAGPTPLAAALAAVPGDFADQPAGDRAVVLLGDGEESCGGDPLAVVRAQHERGEGLPVHVIAVGVKGDDAPGLREIASLSGGSFSSAGDPAELERALALAVQREFRLEDADGHTVLRGVVGDPPRALPVGCYRLVIPAERLTLSVTVAAGRLARVHVP